MIKHPLSHKDSNYFAGQKVADNFMEGIISHIKIEQDLDRGIDERGHFK